MIYPMTTITLTQLLLKVLRPGPHWEGEKGRSECGLIPYIQGHSP